MVMAAFFATFMGCSGSTAGGIKAYRFVILFNVITTGLKKLIYPNAVYSVRYGNQTVDAETSARSSCSSAPMSSCGSCSSSGPLPTFSVLQPPSPAALDRPRRQFRHLRDPELYLLSLMMLLGRLEVLCARAADADFLAHLTRPSTSVAIFFDCAHMGGKRGDSMQGRTGLLQVMSHGSCLQPDCRVPEPQAGSADRSSMPRARRKRCRGQHRRRRL